MLIKPLILRTVATYLYLIVIMRLLGKRQLGELEISELIVAFMLSEIATTPIIDTSYPFTKAIIPVLILCTLEICVAFLSIKFPLIKRTLFGTPSVIIYKGQLDIHEMKRQRIELSELVASARQAGINDFADVSCCILEQCGKLSFFKRSDGEVALPIIMDRRIITRNLKLIGKNRVWLRSELEKKKLTEAGIFLLSANSRGDIYIIERKK